MQTTIARPSEAPPWTRVASEVNAWRGACIQSFARAEAAVTETLLVLGRSGQRGTTVRLRHLVGQRLDDLAKAIGPDGAFAAEGAAAHAVLARFRTHEALRAHLAHDVARIAVERNGTWVVVFRHLSIRSGRPERATVAFEQSGAAETAAELKRDIQQLESALANLRRAVELQGPA